MIEILSIGSPAAQAAALASVASRLLAGELAILPTDTLYALSCAALDPQAARRLRAAKGRDEGKPLPIVVAGLEQLKRICPEPPAGLEALARRFWPGALSLVLEAGPALPEAVTCGTASVAVRVPALGFLRELCEQVGPLVSTSANRSGEAPPRSCREAVLALGSAASIAVDAGPGTQEPSTLVDLTGPRPRLLRAGRVSWAEVGAFLRSLPA